MREPRLPNFFVVGTGKAGTTSLYHYLRQHPQIFMSPIKEPCYFASEIRESNLDEMHKRHIRQQSRKFPDVERMPSEWEDYARLFENAGNETAVGESSASYLWSESAPAGIASRVPDAKIVMILRHPAERAFSQYLHQLAVGLTRSSFSDHIRKCVENRDRTISVWYPFLEIGLYHDQVKRYLDRFPRNNVRIYWFEEAWRQPDNFIADIFRFLNVDSAFLPDMSHKSLQRKAPRSPVFNYAAKRFDVGHRVNDMIPAWMRMPIRKKFFRHGTALAMDAEDRRFLMDYYREDIGRLASLVDRDLNGWLR